MWEGVDALVECALVFERWLGPIPCLGKYEISFGSYCM
jgi:hypothetical protein